MQYWIQGFDSNGDTAATSGDPKHPFAVPVRSEIASEPPHLPGRAAPQTCAESASPEEVPAERDREPVEAAPEPEERPRGESKPAPYARWWVGVAGAIDFLSLPAGNDLCSLTETTAPANASGYYCTNPDGSNFPSRTDRHPELGARSRARRARWRAASAWATSGLSLPSTTR